MNESPTEWLHDTLIRLIADTDDSMEFMGSVFNPKDSAQRKVSKSLERAEQAILNHVEATTVPLLDQKCYNCGNFTVAIDNRARCPYCGGHGEISTRAKQLLKVKD